MISSKQRHEQPQPPFRTTQHTFHLNSSYKLSHFLLSQAFVLFILAAITSLCYLNISSHFIFAFLCMPLAIVLQYAIHYFAWNCGDWRTAQRRGLLSGVGVCLISPIFLAVYIIVWQPTLQLEWQTSSNCQVEGSFTTSLGNNEYYGLQYVILDNSLIGLSCVTNRKTSGSAMNVYEFYRRKPQESLADSSSEEGDNSRRLSSTIRSQETTRIGTGRSTVSNADAKQEQVESNNDEHHHHTWESQRQQLIDRRLDGQAELKSSRSIRIQPEFPSSDGFLFENKDGHSSNLIESPLRIPQPLNQNRFLTDDSFQSDETSNDSTFDDTEVNSDYQFSEVKIANWLCSSREDNNARISQDLLEPKARSCSFTYYGEKGAALENSANVEKALLIETEDFIIVSLDDEIYFSREGFIMVLILLYIPSITLSFQVLAGFLAGKLLFAFKGNAIQEEFLELVKIIAFQKAVKCNQQIASSESERAKQRISPEQIVQILSPKSLFLDRDIYNIYKDTRRREPVEQQQQQQQQPDPVVNQENTTRFVGQNQNDLTNDQSRSVFLTKEKHEGPRGSQQSNLRHIDDIDMSTIRNQMNHLTDNNASTLLPFQTEEDSMQQQQQRVIKDDICGGEQTDRDSSYLKIREIYKRKLNPQYQKETRILRRAGSSVSTTTNNEEIELIRMMKKIGTPLEPRSPLKERNNFTVFSHLRKESDTISAVNNLSNAARNLLRESREHVRSIPEKCEDILETIADSIPDEGSRQNGIKINAIHPTYQCTFRNKYNSNTESSENYAQAPNEEGTINQLK